MKKLYSLCQGPGTRRKSQSRYSIGKGGEDGGPTGSGTREQTSGDLAHPKIGRNSWGEKGRSRSRGENGLRK